MKAADLEFTKAGKAVFLSLLRQLIFDRKEGGYIRACKDAPFIPIRMVDLQEIQDFLISGNASKTEELVKEAVESGVSPHKILNDSLNVGMDRVGVKFQENEFYIPEVLLAARAMHAALDVIRPLLREEGVEPQGKVVIGTVWGDLHDIGKNLVRMMLEGAGFEVFDLGVDVDAEAFVNAAKENRADIVAMSALLTTTMTYMKEVVDALKAAGLRGEIRTLIGGAPVTKDFADEIGADDYAPDAAAAVETAKALIGK